MNKKLHRDANPKNFEFARLNRKAETEAESILWSCLRNKRMDGIKFRRQHPLAYYIADFFCFEYNLVVELDGNFHTKRDQKEYDEGRSFELRELNIKVIRFTNREVIENIEYVLEEIRKAIYSSSQDR